MPPLLYQSMPFLSTLSLRRATHPMLQYGNAPTDFYPRSPCGERLRLGFAPAQQQAISIHALLAESDGLGLISAGLYRISIHALLAESDP